MHSSSYQCQKQKGFFEWTYFIVLIFVHQVDNSGCFVHITRWGIWKSSEIILHYFKCSLLLFLNILVCLRLLKWRLATTCLMKSLKELACVFSCSNSWYCTLFSDQPHIFLYICYLTFQCFFKNAYLLLLVPTLLFCQNLKHTKRNGYYQSVNGRSLKRAKLDSDILSYRAFKSKISACTFPN